MNTRENNVKNDSEMARVAQGVNTTRSPREASMVVRQSIGRQSNRRDIQRQNLHRHGGLPLRVSLVIE